MVIMVVGRGGSLWCIRQSHHQVVIETFRGKNAAIQLFLELVLVTFSVTTTHCGRVITEMNAHNLITNRHQQIPWYLCRFLVGWWWWWWLLLLVVVLRQWCWWRSGKGGMSQSRQCGVSYRQITRFQLGYYFMVTTSMRWSGRCCCHGMVTRIAAVVGAWLLLISWLFLFTHISVSASLL